MFSAGWDINQRKPWGIQRLLDLVAHDEDMVKRCLDHVVQVSDGVEYTAENPYKYPPLLDNIADLGTLSNFKLLRAKGARIGHRMLHKAAESAGSCNLADRPERMAVLRFLVEEERLDVNQMDTDGKMPNHRGTPDHICSQWKRRFGCGAVFTREGRGPDPGGLLGHTRRA